MVEGDGLENRYRACPYRGFESHSLRLHHLYIWGGARVVDWDRLLSGCTFTGTAGSNPVLPVYRKLFKQLLKNEPTVPLLVFFFSTDSFIKL